MFKLVTHPGIKYEDNAYPVWGEILGWLITAVSMLLVPVLIVKTVVDIYCCRKGGEETAQVKNISWSWPEQISGA